MKLLKFWFPVLAYSAIIFGASAMHGTATETQWPGFDKVLHLVLYSPYGWLVARALTGTVSSKDPAKILFWTVLLVLCYGVSDEWHQYYVPGRETDVFDVVADVFGGLLGGYLYIKMNKRMS